jgi:hypothetical protein
MPIRTRTRWAFIRFLRPTPVSMRGRHPLTDRPLELKYSQVPPSCAFVSFRVPSLAHSRSRSFDPSPYLPRVSALLRGIRWRGPHTRRNSQIPSASFRPQVFSTSRRFTPPPTFAGLFQPTDHVQGSFCPFRGVSLHAAHPSSSEGAAPMLLALACSLAETSRHTQTPQLRGLDPHRAAFPMVRN